MIPDTFIQELLYRVDLVEPDRRLRSAEENGRQFAACCPFHSEKSPSFTVSPSKQFYHCFGCGAHGNAISFLMEYSGLGFVDAIKELAGRAGMQRFRRIRDRSSTTPEITSADEIMARAAKILLRAAQAFRKGHQLPQGTRRQRRNRPQVRPRLCARGMAEPRCRFRGLQQPDLQLGGLVIKNERGRLYDRFRDRVMFPIMNQKGEVIALAAACLGRANRNI
jgi:DNA primase